MRSHRSNSFFRWPAAAAALALHLAVLVPIVIPCVGLERDNEISPEVPVTAGFVVLDEAARDTVPVPEVTLKPVSVQTTALSVIHFESADWGDISGVTAPASAPRLSRFQPADPATYARGAGLPAGQAASAVLILEVLPNGTVGAVETAMGFGIPSVDAAAVAYARTLRWIPGTRDHRAEAMRVALPVTLVWTA